MDAPPVAAGADHAIDTVREPIVVVTAVGAEGVVRGVAEVEADGSPAPAALIAETRNAYADPFVNPVTTAFVPELPVFAIAVVHEIPPSDERSTLYPEIGEPLLAVGAFQERITDESCATPANAVGASGAL